MKKLISVCLCFAILLLLVCSCGSTADDEYFIGQITEATDGKLQISVYSQYSEKYGSTVNIESDASAKNLKHGDEVRVTVDSISGNNVKASEIKPLLYNCDQEKIVNYDRITVPEDFPSFLGDVNFTVKDANCFSAFPYRVVKQDIREIYLSSYYETDAQFVIFGNTTSECTVGDFVYVATEKYKVSGVYNAVEIGDLSRLYVASVDSIGEDVTPGGGGVLKPVVYLYPEEKTVVDVKLQLDFDLTCPYPDYNGGEGWKNLETAPDGTITRSGREYYCLYWEGDGFDKADFSKGFCVKGDETAEFLENVLAEIGLNEREANEFIIYWLPVLQQNEYNLISFQGENYTKAADLIVSPKPDSVLRVFMSFKPLKEPVEIEPQAFENFERKGFTVVEWGGGPAKD